MREHVPKSCKLIGDFMNTKLTVLISSCDKFSDLWDAHIKLYRKNWQLSECKTLLVTDKPTSRTFDGIDIVVAKENMDFPMRIQYALSYVTTPYVLVTLDDYFLISTAEREKITALVSYAERDKIDYLMLYDRRKNNPKKYEPVEKLYDIDCEKKYAVTLYPAIWSVSFLEKTAKENVSPWLYEPSLSETAMELNAVCKFSHAGSFEMVDVIRKGKVLHKAKKYFKKHGIDIGDRPVISRWTELKLGVMDFISWHTPKFMFRFIKRTAKKLGMKFYSEG